jgi:tetratricopeptide (TPR) repeat protein
MNIRVKLLLLGTVLVAGGWALNTRWPSPASPAMASVRTPVDLSATSKNIAFYEQRVKSDPQGAIAMAGLADWYLQRSRETGDVADALRAEKMARRSLELRKRRNTSAYHALANSMMTQHRFSDALAVVNECQRMTGVDVPSSRFKIDILLELGRYEEATKALAAIPNHEEGTGDLTLRARFYQLNGQPEDAIWLLTTAAANIDKNIDLPRENIAWFHTKLGNAHAAIGRVGAAEKEYLTAISIFPKSYKAMEGMANLYGDRRQWKEAIAWAKRSTDIMPAPDVFALMGDAHTALGNPLEAKKCYARIDSILKKSAAGDHTEDRHLAMYLADHDLKLDEALKMACSEIKLRKDIYAYDTLAWVSYKCGLLKEADAAMTKALARHTRDASMYYHAAMIARGRGDEAACKRLIDVSAAINPHFHPVATIEHRVKLS